MFNLLFLPGLTVGDHKRSNAALDPDLTSDDRKSAKYYRAPRGYFKPRGDPNVPTTFGYDKACSTAAEPKLDSVEIPKPQFEALKDDTLDQIQPSDEYIDTSLKTNILPMFHIPKIGDQIEQCKLLYSNEQYQNGVESPPESRLEGVYDSSKLNNDHQAHEECVDVIDNIDIVDIPVQIGSEEEKLSDKTISFAKKEGVSSKSENTEVCFPPPEEDLDYEAIYGSSVEIQENIRNNEPQEGKDKIKYSPKELRALNPYNNSNQTNGSMQKLRKYRTKWVTLLKGLPNASILPINTSPTPESNPPARSSGFNGGGDAPLLLVPNGVNFQSWKKIEDLLPPSQIPSQKAAKFAGTSVDSMPSILSMISDIDSNKKTDFNTTISDNITNHSNDSESASKEMCEGVPVNNSDNVLDNTDHSEGVGAEMWDGIHMKNESTNNNKTSKKKKKTKFIPLDNFDVDNKYTGLNDPYGFDDGDDDGEELDDFSEEMLNFYKEFEKQELAGTINAISKPSIYSQVRPSFKSKCIPWEPTGQFCSKCGSRSHIVYSCPLMQDDYTE